MIRANVYAVPLAAAATLLVAGCATAPAAEPAAAPTSSAPTVTVTASPTATATAFTPFGPFERLPEVEFDSAEYGRVGLVDWDGYTDPEGAYSYLDGEAAYYCSSLARHREDAGDDALRSMLLRLVIKRQDAHPGEDFAAATHAVEAAQGERCVAFAVDQLTNR